MPVPVPKYRDRTGRRAGFRKRYRTGYGPVEMSIVSVEEYVAAYA